MAYHITNIDKGILGQFSKIKEEFQEFEDANKQDAKCLEICELADLIGSIEEYIKKYNLTLNDLIYFSNQTKKAFITGKR